MVMNQISDYRKQATEILINLGFNGNDYTSDEYTMDQVLNTYKPATREMMRGWRERVAQNWPTPLDFGDRLVKQQFQAGVGQAIMFLFMER
jgi:hypothetical protein